MTNGRLRGTLSFFFNFRADRLHSDTALSMLGPPPMPPPHSPRSRPPSVTKSYRPGAGYTFFLGPPEGCRGRAARRVLCTSDRVMRFSRVTAQRSGAYVLSVLPRSCRSDSRARVFPLFPFLQFRAKSPREFPQEILYWRIWRLVPLIRRWTQAEYACFSFSRCSSASFASFSSHDRRGEAPSSSLFPQV